MYELTMCQIGKRDELTTRTANDDFILQKEVFFIDSSDRFYEIRDIDLDDSEWHVEANSVRHNDLQLLNFY